MNGPQDRKDLKVALDAKQATEQKAKVRGERRYSRKPIAGEDRLVRPDDGCRLCVDCGAKIVTLWKGRDDWPPHDRCPFHRSLFAARNQSDRELAKSVAEVDRLRELH